MCQGLQCITHPLVVIIEADGTCNPQEIPALLNPFIRDHNVGLVVGSRVTCSNALYEKVNYSVYDAIKGKLASVLYNIRYGLSIDPTSKFFALKKEILTQHEYTNLSLSKHFLLQLAVRVIQKGYTVLEVPVSRRRRRST